MSSALSLSPIMLFVILLMVARMSMQFVAPIVFLYTLGLALWYQTQSPVLQDGILPEALDQLTSVALKSTLVTTDILLIAFGAIVFLSYLKQSGKMNEIHGAMQSLSIDRRVQAILLAWLFGSFIEGTSGFGTPAMVVAPLMVATGFPPTSTIVICLLANSTAVAFGAIGTPVQVGFSGFDISSVAEKAAVINFACGLIVPLLILHVVVRAEPNPIRSFFNALPWSIFAGLSFLVPYLLFSYLGHEFPSVFGAAIGLLVVILSITKGHFLPATTFRFSTDTQAPSAPFSPTKLIRAAKPYILLLLVLLVGKLLFEGLSLRLDLGNKLSHTVHAFNPGFAFLTVTLLSALFGKPVPFLPNPLNTLRTFNLLPLAKTASSIFFVTATTYVMILTSHGTTSGMLQPLSDLLHSSMFPLASVFLGAFGAFLAGSATVSNLLFAPVQTLAAEQLSIPSSWALALQLVGAGIGNMIALPNILAVQAALGVRDQESTLIWRLLIPCLLYILMAGTVGWLFM